MIRKLHINVKQLKDVINKELMAPYNGKLKKGKLLKGNREVRFSGVKLEPQSGVMHLLNDKEQVEGIYTYNNSEEQNITLTIESVKISIFKVKRITRNDTNDMLELVFT